MKKHSKKIFMLAMFLAFMVALFFPGQVGAGDLTPPGAPGSTMHTLEDIYNILNAFTKTPEEVCDGRAFFGIREDGEIVERTGTKTDCQVWYRDADGDEDGAPLVTFVSVNQPSGYVSGRTDCDDSDPSVNNCRFCDLGNGTVRDNDSGLIWLKDAEAFGQMNWDSAMNAAATLNSGEKGLTDGSSEGDWRLPTNEEWGAFVVGRYTEPALCNAAGTSQWTQGDAFIDVQSYLYWSSTEYVAGVAFFGGLNDGFVGYDSKDRSYYVWPVRSDN